MCSAILVAVCCISISATFAYSIFFLCLFAIETHHLPCPSLANELFIVVYIILGLAILISQVGIVSVARVVVLGVHHSCIWWRETRGRYVIYLVMFYVSVDV